MASAWGIDIGQAGLKAMRLRSDEDSGKVRATAFDYIPHPKILSQPDAIPEELISQAVSTFLSRNKIEGDLIAVSVSGQTSLAKFIKLPPVEPSKVAEIVKYEAKQQIPFDLEEVVWDYQPIGGGVEESGFMLEAEVGLFAMKRELIYQAMRPLTDNGAEVELVQISPLALYNYLSYDVLGFRRTEETPEPPNSEDYYIVLDMGADNTTLLVSNGRNIWIRNVPIGGNHFTRSLTREMKLTFAKAEHLKCNATKAPDPKAVFQAMRPVFNDYVTEIQRSIGYFGSVNRAAKIKKVIGVGNGFKLAGLQKFLQQNLQYDVVRLEHLDGVSGDSVLTDPLFMDNMMTFAVPYGLALQTLGQTRIHTSLLPPEIVVERKIRRKKPWAVAAAAGLLLATGISTFASARVLQTVSVDRFAAGQKAVDDLKSKVSRYDGDYNAQVSAHDKILGEIEQIAAPLQRRELWMEVFQAVNECLPMDEGDAMDEPDLQKQRKIRVDSLVSMKVADVGEWHAAMIEGEKEEDFHVDDRTNKPAGEGYIFTVTGHHYYNSEDLGYRNIAKTFIDETLVANLRKWEIERNGAKVPVGKLGISHPLVVWNFNSKIIDSPNAPRMGAGGMGMTGMGPGGGYPGGSGGMDGGMGMMMGGGYPGGGYPGGGGGDGGLSGGGYPGGGYPGGGGATMGPMMGGGMAPAMGSGGMTPAMGSGGMGGGYPGGGYPGGGGMPGPGYGGAGMGRQLGPVDSLEDEEGAKPTELERTDFVLQFVWIPTLPVDRKDQPPASEGAPAADAAAAETPAE
ncbi:MAG: type IV pilus assembly protein PilM [Planctomycetaceae bacterium]